MIYTSAIPGGLDTVTGCYQLPLNNLAYEISVCNQFDNTCSHIFNDLISQASTLCDKLLIRGDFNMKDIDWHFYSTIHSNEHIEHEFIECLRDNFLYQHVLEPTRYRENQTCNTLDLVISSEEQDIRNLEITPSLGVSDHATIIFDFVCTYKSKVTLQSCNMQNVTLKDSKMNGRKSIGKKNLKTCR